MTTKIIRIIARLNIGGPAIHTILLTSALNKSGYKDILVTGRVSDTEGDMLYLAKEHGVEPVLIPELGREISLKNDLRAFFKLYSMIRREKPDIVHTHTAKAGTLGRLAAILAGVPVKIHTFHGHAFDGYFSPAKAKIFLWIERLLGSFTDKVVAVSETIRKEIVDNLKVVNKNKCVVIPLGFELEKFIDSDNLRGRFRAKLKVPADILLVGIVGRLVPIKNHMMFLKTIKKVREHAPGLRTKFVIIGDGELKSRLVDTARDMGLSDLIFTGWVKDLAEVYADLDIVVLTSLNEGTPVSMIEAMASARPVIATDVGGVKDLIRNNIDGMLIGSNDVEGFSAAIIGLLGDGDRRHEMGACGRESVRKKYCKERLFEDIRKLYKEVIDK